MSLGIIALAIGVVVGSLGVAVICADVFRQPQNLTWTSKAILTMATATMWIRIASAIVRDLWK